MDLLTLIVWIALIGFLVWLVVTFIPMPAPFKQVIIVAVVIVLVLFIARALLGGGGPVLRLP